MDMSTLAASLMADTRIIPVKRENKVVEATKLPDGSLSMRFGDGRTGVLGPDQIDLQAFVVWTMLNSDCTEA
jgi:hypothetical protein